MPTLRPSLASPRARRQRNGAGDRQVAGRLAALAGHGWLAVEDVYLGPGAPGQLMVGPGGVFTLRADARPGTVDLARLSRATLRRALAPATLIAPLAGTRVETMLVFCHARLDRPIGLERGVIVIDLEMAAGYLRARPTRLAEDDVRAVHARLARALGRRVRTVHSSPSATDEPAASEPPPAPGGAIAVAA